jgi:hypothetical protein
VRVIARPELWPTFLRCGGPLRRAPVWPAEQVAAEEGQGFAYLNEVARRFRLPAGTVVTVPVGDPYLRLAAEVRRRPAPLVVVANRDSSRPTAMRDRLVPRLLRSGVAPVLAVRADAANPAGVTAGVLVRADGQDSAVAPVAGGTAGSHELTA